MARRDLNSALLLKKTPRTFVKSGAFCVKEKAALDLLRDSRITRSP